MGRPKLSKTDKKIKLGITISKEANEKLEKFTTNKSKFIEDIIIQYKK